MEIHRTKILGFRLLLFGLALCGTGLWLLLSPEQYRATARIKIEPPEPSFAWIICEEIKSEVVFSNAVKTLNLNAGRNKKHTGRTWFKTADTMKLLRRRVVAYAVPNTHYLIEVRATSKDPDEAAKIANAIAEAYREFRIEYWRQCTLGGIKVLTEQYQNEEEQIQVAQTNVEWVRGEYKITNDVPPPELQQEWQRVQNYWNERHEALPGQPYWEEKRKLDRMIELHKQLKQLKAKIEEEQKDIGRPDNPGFSREVKFVDLAIPPQTPEGPNRLLGAILFAIGLGMTAGKFVLTRFSRRQPA